MSSTPDYLERLWPPPSWWLLGLLAVGSACLALAVSTPGAAVATGTTVVAAAWFGALLALGRVQVGVRDGEVVAGRAHVPLALCGAVEALDAERARLARGVDADARAFLLLRPYLPLAVRVELADPGDPTPYWLISARRPDRVVQAAQTARVRHDDAMARKLSSARRKKSDSPVKDAQQAGVRPTSSRKAKRLWKVYSRGATVLSGVVTLRLTQTVWQVATKKKPPNSPEHPDVDAREAIVWAVLSGATTELVKIAISRKTAQYWVRSTGNLPPDMDPIDD